MTIAPQPIINDAHAYQAIPQGMIWYAVLAALVDINNGDPVPTTAQGIIDEAQCLESCIPAGYVPYAILAQLANLTGGGGTGDVQGFSGAYGGGEPTETPTSSTAVAFDTDSDPAAISYWYGGAWH